MQITFFLSAINQEGNPPAHVQLRETIEILVVKVLRCEDAKIPAAQNWRSRMFIDSENRARLNDLSFHFEKIISEVIKKKPLILKLGLCNPASS